MTETDFYWSLTGQAAGLAVGGIVQALILKWRLGKTADMNVLFWPAYFFSLKISMAAFLISFSVGVFLALANFNEGSIVYYLIPAFGLVGWWYLHTYYLIKFAQKRSYSLSMIQSRGVSGTVFVGSAVIFPVSLLLVLYILGRVIALF